MHMENSSTPRKVFVAQSGIHGKGMFARKPLKKGETVFIFKGKVFHKVNKGKEDTYGNPNAIGIAKDMWISPRGNFQYINHSCNPNMGIKGTVTFVALRDIKKGEELTFDYSIIEEDRDWVMKNGEKPGKGFRKEIGSIHTLPLEAYRRYLPYVPTYFQMVYNRHHNLKPHAAKR